MNQIRAEASERAILAAALKDPDRLVFLEIETTPEDFTGLYRPRLRELILRLHHQGVPVTFDLLESSFLSEQKDANIAIELDAIRAEVVTSDAWSWHGRMIRSASVRRYLAKQGDALTKAALNGETDEDLLNRAQEISIRAGGLEVKSSQVVPGGDATAEVKTDYFQGKTGFIDLHMGPKAYPFRGLRPGEVFTVLAKTWVGKSLWASQLAINAGVPVLVVSLEMPRVQWWERTLMQFFGRSRLDVLGRVVTGQLTPHEQGNLAALERRMTLCDRCEGTLPALEAAIKRSEAVLHVHPRLVIIDYLQLLNLAGQRGASAYQKASEAAVEVKRLAKRAEIAIVLLSQISRKDGVDGASDVSMESARDSGQIEEAADFLLGLWRPCLRRGITRAEYEAQEPIMRGRLLKNRRGRAFEWNFHLHTGSLQILPE